MRVLRGSPTPWVAAFLLAAALLTGCRREIKDVQPGGGPSYGPHDAAVTIVVFSDFQCPYCAQLARTLDAVRDRFGPSIRIVFRHFPLRSHKFAQQAAEAAMAAHAQGKFWAYHDALFADPKALGQKALIQTAGRLGLDKTQFAASLKARQFQKAVDDDYAYGQSLGLKSTPTVFVNGIMFRGAVGETKLAGVIEDELDKAAP